MPNNLSLHCIFFLALSCACPGQAPEVTGVLEEEMAEPTCVFSGMIWQGASIEGLGYFVEGKAQEKDKQEGKFTKVFLPNGGRSRKYAYYGAPPLVFYREIEVEEEEDKPDPKDPPTAKPEEDEEADEKKEKKIVYVPIASCAFERDWKEIFMFFFVSGEAEPTYQVRAINFNTTHFPAGHFWFFSRCEQPVSILFGLDKGQLAAGGQAMFKARLNDAGDLPIRVFHDRKGVPRPVYSTFWNYNPNSRSLVFLMPKLRGVKVRRIVDFVQEEQALGLRPPTEEEKRKASPGPSN